MSRIEAERPAPGSTRAPSRMPMRPRLALAAVILLIAFNLRPAVSSLSPVLTEVLASTGLTASDISLLSMAQVIFIGLFAATVPPAVRRFGLERAALLAMAAIMLGSMLRGLGNVPTLALGGLVACAGIGAGNVIVPGLLKRDFADRTAAMSGLYSMVLCFGATLPVGATAPLRIAFGGSWPWALEFWALPAAITLAAAAFLWRGVRNPVQVAQLRGKSLLRDPLAWNVTLYMGLQSMLAYSILSWMAPILRSRGDDPVKAGLVTSVALIAQVAASLPAPIFAARLKRQSLPALVAILFTLTGFLGLIYADLSWQWVGATVMGAGMGGCFGMAVLLMVLRAPNAAMAARLSAMAQTAGYLIASFGPLVIGIAHDITGDWLGAVIVFVVATAVGGANGYLAGRNRQVGV